MPKIIKTSRNRRPTIYVGDTGADEPVRANHKFELEIRMRRSVKLSEPKASGVSENPVTTKTPIFSFAPKGPSKKRIKNATIGIEIALERQDRVNALAIAGRNQLSDEVRTQLGLGASLSAAEIARRTAALAAATHACAA